MKQTKQTQEKEFIVVWHYCANYGKDVLKGSSAEEVIRNHLFYGRKDIELLAFENNKETSAVKQFGDDSVLNPKDGVQ